MYYAYTLASLCKWAKCWCICSPDISKDGWQYISKCRERTFSSLSHSSSRRANFPPLISYCKNGKSLDFLSRMNRGRHLKERKWRDPILSTTCILSKVDFRDVAMSVYFFLGGGGGNKSTVTPLGLMHLFLCDLPGVIIYLMMILDL